MIIGGSESRKTITFEKDSDFQKYLDIVCAIYAFASYMS